MQCIAKSSMFSILLIQMMGCGPGAALEYGDAAAHFNEDSVLEKAKPFLGKKIVVKGDVTKQDLADPENCKIYLGHSICCNLKHLQRMAKGCTVDKTVFIGGILKRCEEGDILLEPAMKRDSKAEFNPVE